MDGDDRSGFFRGHELSRMLVLMAIALAGWVALYYYASRTSEEPEPEQVVTGKPPAVEPDRSPEFETVADKTVVSFRDTAAYDKLLTRARGATPAGLAAEARRDVFYAHLWDFPREYRGVPVRLAGTVLRVLYYKSEQSRTGWLYEAWVVAPGLTKNPYVCVFEDAPIGLPLGQNLSERVVFNGYFLKLMRYESGDGPRAAPLLIGRLLWAPRPGGSGADSNRSVYWLMGGLALMFLVSLARWAMALGLSFPGKRAARRPDFERPNDTIAPEELAAFLGGAAEEGEIPADEARGS